jgi:multiple sugar transport system substrate-binding protein
MSPTAVSRINRRQLSKAAAATPLLAAGVLAASPASGLAQDKTDVRIISYTVNESWDALVTEMIESFNTESTLANASIEFRPAEQYWDKLQTEFAGGNAPDITLVNSEWIGAGASRGMFTDLNPLYERDGVDLSDLWYDMEPEWGWEGGMYGALLYAGGQAFYVNKGLLEAAGESMPAEGWTWDDLLASAQVLTDADNQQYGLFIAPLAPPHWSCSFIHGAGGTVLNDARDECTLNSEESRAGLQWLVDAINTHGVMPTPGAFEGQDNPFLSGKIAYFIGGTWEESAIRTTDIDWDFVPMPVHPTTGITSVQLGSNAWSMLSTTSNEDATWEVMQFLGGPVASAALLTLGVPGFSSVIDSQEYLDLHAPQDISIVINDFQNYGHDYYTTPDAAEWLLAVTNELGPMWIGEDTVENSTQRATDAVNEIFAFRDF